jgi:hypothetical protein
MAALTSIAIAGLAAAGGMAVAGAMAKKPQAPAAGPDPVTERAKAETEAVQKTNSKLAQRNRARQASSLLAKPVDSASSDVTALGGGKTTLGQ